MTHAADATTPLNSTSFSKQESQDQDPLENLEEWKEFHFLLKKDFDPVAYASDIMEKNTEIELKHASLIHASRNVDRQIQELVSQHHPYFLSLINAFAEYESQVQEKDKVIREKKDQLRLWKASLIEPQHQIQTYLNLVNEQSKLVMYYQGLLRYFRLTQPILDADEKILEHHVSWFVELAQFKSDLDLSSIELFDRRDQLVQTKKARLELRLTQLAESKDPVQLRKGVQGLLLLGRFKSWRSSYLHQRQGYLEARLKAALETDKSLGGKLDPERQWEKIEQFFDILYEEAMNFTQLEEFSGDQITNMPSFWKHTMSMFHHQFHLAMQLSKHHSTFFASHYPRLLRLLRHFVTRMEPSSIPKSSFLDCLSFLHPIFTTWSESVLRDNLQNVLGGPRSPSPSQVQMLNLAHTFLAHVEVAHSDTTTLTTVLQQISTALDTLTTRLFPSMVSEKETDRGSFISCINALHGHYTTLLQGFKELHESHWSALLPSLTRMHVSLLQAMDRLLEPLVSQLCGLFSQMIIHVTWFEEANTQLRLAKSCVHQLQCGDDRQDILRVLVQTLFEWMVYSFSLVPMVNDKRRLQCMTELGNMEQELAEILEPAQLPLWELPAYAAMKIVKSVLFANWQGDLLDEMKQALSSHPRLLLCHIASSQGIIIHELRHCSPKDCVGWLVDLRELNPLIKLLEPYPEMTRFLEVVSTNNSF